MEPPGNDPKLGRLETSGPGGDGNVFVTVVVLSGGFSRFFLCNDLFVFVSRVRLFCRNDVGPGANWVVDCREDSSSLLNDSNNLALSHTFIKCVKSNFPVLGSVPKGLKEKKQCAEVRRIRHNTLEWRS